MAAEQLDLGAMNDRELLLLTARAVNDLSSQMELMRTRYHDLHDNAQGHESSIELQAKGLAVVIETNTKCREFHTAAIDAINKSLREQENSRNQNKGRLQGVLVGLSYGTGGGVVVAIVQVLLKAFSG